MYDIVIARLLSQSWAIALVLLLHVCAPCQRSLDASDIIFHSHGTDSTSHLGWLISCVGDVNSDGYDDIAMSSGAPSRTSSDSHSGTYIFYGGNPPDTLPDMFLLGGYGPATAIDLDGDGFNELITADVFGHISLAEEGRIYFYEGFGDSVGSVPYDSIYPETDNYRFGWWFRAAYVDEDSLGDIVAIKPTKPGGEELLFFSGAPTSDIVADWVYQMDDPRLQTAGNFGFIDFDGDQRLDVFSGRTGDDLFPPHVRIFLYPDYGTSPDIVIAPPEDLDTLLLRAFARGVYNIGDINGDGWEDLGVGFFYNALVYLGGPSADTIYDYRLENRITFMAPAGDVNGDGYNDLITGSSSYGEFGGIDIYLGGPEFDIYVDAFLVRSNLPPLFLDEIGYRVSSAGDFNGDGYDDIILSCQNFSGGFSGDVFVIKGSAEIITGVEDRSDPVLPLELNLRQNYPNPFNATTTIEFESNRRSHVTLMIHNVLGEHVITLLDQEFSTGTGSITWDGKNRSGRAVSSGVYLYTLEMGEHTVTKKMLLLK